MTYFLFILGFALLYFVSRRKFNKRNVAGLEEYNSFEHAVGNSFLNKVLKVVAYLLIICGVINCKDNMFKKSEPKKDKIEQNTKK